MKILVYGAGVLGCNLARNLFHAGKDVTLLARGNQEERTADQGSILPPHIGQQYSRGVKTRQ